MMDYEIFKSEKDKKEALLVLPELARHPGWKYIERVLERNIERLKTRLTTDEDFKTLEEVFFEQDRLADLESLRSLPATLITEAREKPDTEEDDDIYESSPAEDTPKT